MQLVIWQQAKGQQAVKRGVCKDRRVGVQIIAISRLDVKLEGKIC